MLVSKPQLPANDSTRKTLSEYRPPKADWRMGCACYFGTLRMRSPVDGARSEPATTVILRSRLTEKIQDCTIFIVVAVSGEDVRQQFFVELV